ncbi:5'-3' exonuclease [Alicyclobacillus macrosporangiidus]|uniref:5'-3' exonuclease n=1 Tax=Alicyclobacillus macrosporangiidus TaxID=392015 RepID=UPI00068BC7A6|nr:5'-3' exonuclease H3TH domain-containing protein [Alicyclobacillus macrosporangiidus]
MVPADVLLIDGSSLLVRAYFGTLYGGRPRRAADGRYTNGVMGFLHMFTHALERVRPRYVAIAWDTTRDTFRRDLYPAYKAQRGELPEALLEQFETTQQVLGALGVAQHADHRYEADDILGTLAHRCQEEGWDGLVLTGDRDALQLVADGVRVCILRRGVAETDVYTPATLLETWGLTPSQIVDLKALMGDASDNIPGVPGVGEKTAKKLLAEHGTLEGVLANAEALPVRLRDRIVAHRETALLSKRLATIVTDVPLPFDLADCLLRVHLGDALEALRALELERAAERLARAATAAGAAG